MTIFVAIAALFIALALALLLVPLLRRGEAGAGPVAEASNLSVLRHQLAEAEAERSAKTLSEEHYRQAKADIERRVLDEVAGAPAAVRTRSPRSARWTAVAIGVALPVIAVALYMRLGSPDALLPREVTREEIEALAGRLATRLEREPNDARGWGVLALSYSALQKYREAASVYSRLAELTPDDADVLANYAEALAMSQGRRLTGAPLELAQRALELDPAQWKALGLVASEAFVREDYATAIGHWEKLRNVAPPELANAVDGYIAEANQRARAAAVAHTKGAISRP